MARAAGERELTRSSILRQVLLISAVVLGLAGCQKNGVAAAAGPAAAPAAETAATPGDAPHRRAGLWEQSISHNGTPLPIASTRICVDEAMESKGSFASMNSGDSGVASPCGRPTITRGPDGGYSFTHSCRSGGITTLTKGTITGDLQNSYTIQIDTVTSGAPIAAANGHHVVEMSGKWLGPCPAGMSGGDVQLGNGMQIKGGKLAGAAAMLKNLRASSGGQ